MSPFPDTKKTTPCTVRATGSLLRQQAAVLRLLQLEAGDPDQVIRAPIDLVGIEFPQPGELLAVLYRVVSHLAGSIED